MDDLKNKRHSLAHVMSMAVTRLFDKNVLRGVGPAIDNGFYQDFDYHFSDSDLPKIEEEMRRIIDEDLKFVKEEVTIDEAVKYYEDLGQKYKLELLHDIKTKGSSKMNDDEEDADTAALSKKGMVKFYGIGDYKDLCRGGHVESTGELKKMGYKVDRLAGAYWRGNEKNPMLQRMYGIAFGSQTELDDYLFKIKEAKKRDHRKLGKELGLFTFSPLVGSGLPLYTQKGALIRRLLTGYIEELQSKEEYMQVWTPQIAKADLFKKSGHYDKYHEDMFKVVSNYSDEEMYLKPMNCPQHTQIYDSEKRSYRELPIRMTDFAMLYRDERPGELNGLARVRSFSQDDCHIFCTEDQVDEEIDKALQMTKKVMQTFGFKYKYRLSTRDPKNPDKYLGDPKTWDKVEKWAVDIMKRNNIDFFDGPGEAAFYAPKMDLIATDALGREWQLSTVQIDYVMPQRFNLSYTDSDGQTKSPVMLHRAIMGSAERCMMILLEHFAGNFPSWLAPIQIKVLPINDKCIDYAKKVEQVIKEEGEKYGMSLRVEVDARKENLQKKIADASDMKPPYILICGQREAEANKVAIRVRAKGDVGTMDLEELAKAFVDEVKSRSLNNDIKG